MAFVVGVGELGEGGAQPLAHHGRAGVLVVQVQCIGQQTDVGESAAHDIERGTLLGDEEHRAAMGELVGEDVRDGLRLAGAGWTLQHEGAPGARGRDGFGLRAVRRDRRRGDDGIECGDRGVDLGGLRVDESVCGSEGQVPGDRLVEEPPPVFVEVAPQQIAREADDGQPGVGDDREG